MGLNLTDIATAFMSLLLEGLPFIFLGTLVSGFIDQYLPSGLMERVLPKRPFFAILLSGLLGIVFPVCECAIVPVIGRLIRKGLPIACAVTYMLAAPIINPITVVSTMSAFSGGMQEAGALVDLQNHPIFVTGSRILIAYLVCVLVGLVIQRFSPASIMRPHVVKEMEALKPEPSERAPEEGHPGAGEHAHDHDHTHDHHESNNSGGGSRLVGAFRTAMRDCVDTGMYFTIGALLAAIFNTSTLQKTAADFMSANIFVAVAGMMVLAFILSLCSTSDAFVGATLKVALPSQAYEYAAKLGFLVFGPMMDVKLLFMYSSIFRARFVWGLLIGLFLLVGLVCSAWSMIPLDALPFK